MAVKIELDPVGRIRALADTLDPDGEGLTLPLIEAGGHLLSRMQSSFRTQGRTVPWARRMTPNVPAVVASLNKSATPKPQHLRPGPALWDTGRLRNSITFKATKDSLTIGTSVPYAETMQFGGTTHHTLTETGKVALTRFLGSAAGAEYRKGDANLGWLFEQPSFDVEVAPRKFIEITDEDKADVAEIIRLWLGRVANGSS